MSILIIDNFDSFTFNLYQLLSMSAGCEVMVKRNNEMKFAELRSLNASHIVLSPGPGHPKNERDFGVCKDVVERASELTGKILGVCLGHQGIVQYCGGNVIKAETACHGKMSPIKIVSKSPLFSGIDSGSLVMRYHSLIAERRTLPAALKVTAELEADANVIMAVEDTSGKLFGVQFHPESVGTDFGKKLLENFIALC